MQTLLSLPANLVSSFEDFTHQKGRHFFVDCDPGNVKVGSGGGTAWLLSRHFKKSSYRNFDEYLKSDKKIIIHAGGQSRRLPAYAPSGKIFTPIPVFRWSRGQHLDQNLLDLQLPLYERLMEMTNSDTNTLVASGDVLIQYDKLPAELPDADVICLGIWVDPQLASRHGVFFTPRDNSSRLDFMLQKPALKRIEELMASHLFLMDVGVWMLSDKAVKRLMESCEWQNNQFTNEIPSFYDLYSSFGKCLGQQPEDKSFSGDELSVAIVPLENGAFYHYGTSEELITSTGKIQNSVKDRRAILHNRAKPHPSLFVQNAITQVDWDDGHHHIWIENSVVPSSWTLSNHHVITGVPVNTWQIDLPPGICLDVIPVGDDYYCLRPYHIRDVFSGEAGGEGTSWEGIFLFQWFDDRQLTFQQAGFNEEDDIQEIPLFPLIRLEELDANMLKWMMPGGEKNDAIKQIWLESERLSASEISERINFERLFSQRSDFRKNNLELLSKNYRHSVFYQADLNRIASDFVESNIEIPAVLPESESPFIRFRNHMLRSRIIQQQNGDGSHEAKQAFGILQDAIIGSVSHQEIPALNVYPDQIVWARSPARLDLAGGWSDTPPYCLQTGGRVVNLAVNLNGQPPLQVFIRLSTEPHIVLRSIDNGVSETITTFDDLIVAENEGSSFSIPRAALCLAGFHPDYCGAGYTSLAEQLQEFGGGFEMSLLAAIPKGSGLGTSSVLASTIMGALADFCNLSWDKQAIAHRTLVLEQMLTTGGGWQDQYGGIFPGLKLLETVPGMQEQMGIRWLPERLFTQMPYKRNWLLYYTGITRIAKNILGEIVRGMFLNEGERLHILDAIKDHAGEMFDVLQQCDFEKTGRMIKRSWELNKALDPGTTTPEISEIINRVSDFTFGHKLLGAGGGGYLLMCAKDEIAAANIREILENNPPNNKARFVEMELNNKGLEVSRS